MNGRGSSAEIRKQLVEALKLDLVGSPAGHALAEERLPGWKRPSKRYLTGFLIPSGTRPEKSTSADDLDVVAESAGLVEESNEERKAAKKGFFPGSMGLSFLVFKETRVLDVTVRWGDYEQRDVATGDGKSERVWQRLPREATLSLTLAGESKHDVPRSGGLQVHVVKRLIAAEDLEAHLPRGARSISVFIVNHRAPVDPPAGEPDVAYAFQAEIEVRSETRSFRVRRAHKPLAAEGWIESRTGKLWKITDAGRKAAEQPAGKT